MLVLAAILAILFLIAAPLILFMCIYFFSRDRMVPAANDLEIGQNKEKVPATDTIPVVLPATPAAGINKPKARTEVNPKVGQNMKKLPATTIPAELPRTPPDKMKLKRPGPRGYSYRALEKITDGFSDEKKIGEGGFGEVYKGILRDKEVAVKKLRAGSGQGDDEFQTEVEIISRLHHKHLVRLIGYCIDGKNRLLVYEFIENNSLRVNLHGEGRPTLKWQERMKIAIGSAIGLEYLHDFSEPKIIHRDVKSDNILLDKNFEAKVADFGLAKLFQDFVSHISTDPKGTPGYLDPHYFKTRELTDKSDVYSYGVVLLELISGKKHIDEGINIVTWAKTRIKQALKTHIYEELVDPRLKKVYSFDEMTRMINCAAACVREEPQDRPTMREVVHFLAGISTDGICKGNESRNPATKPLSTGSNTDYQTCPATKPPASVTYFDYPASPIDTDIGCGNWFWGTYN